MAPAASAARLRCDWRRTARGITVNAVCPGIVDTPLMDRVICERGRLLGKQPGQLLAEMAATRIPLGRIEQPEDVAPVVAFLATDDANYMTGQAVNVCGGLVMW